MMKTIELEKEEIYCGNLLLVNKNYPLRDNNVKGLVPADVRFPNILMKRDVANVLQLIFEKISAGNSIVPVSGYRSLEEQTAIYDGSLKDNGEDFTRKYVALPNHSEHQTGLKIDKNVAAMKLIEILLAKGMINQATYTNIVKHENSHISQAA